MAQRQGSSTPGAVPMGRHDDRDGSIMITAQGCIEDLLSELRVLGERELLALAEHGRAAEEPPAFTGRCLEPAYLTAIASGIWSAEDEQRLDAAFERVETAALRRVARRHRRGLRTALRSTTLSVCTAGLPLADWTERRVQLARAWESVVGPLPEPSRSLA